MKVEQVYWTEKTGWQPARPGSLGLKVQLVLVFASRLILENNQWLSELKAAYHGAQIIGCSASGEIFETQVLENSLVVTAVEFEHTEVKAAKVKIADVSDSARAGKELAELLYRNDLRHVFVLSEGLHINGSALVQGLTESLPEVVTVTGGLSSDGDRFEKTLVLLNQQAQSKEIVAVGLYGERLKVSYAAAGGFDSFGPERLITKSNGNVLYELDHKPALDLYQQYLGEYAKDLPASGMYFPLQLIVNGRGVVRTILAMDKEVGSITFAGDIPQNIYARLMKGKYTGMIKGAETVAQISAEALGVVPAELAIMVSCVGRKLILTQRVEEETEAVQNILGTNVTLAGFYSYGEIAPFQPGTKSELHNQTMTITVLAES